VEFLVCMLLASILTGGRGALDIIHAIKGTTPPHVEKARIKATATKTPKGKSDYARGKPGLKDVAAVYWGDAMADAIDLHNRRRERKKTKIDEPAMVKEPKGPGWLAQFWDLMLNGRRDPAGVPAASPSSNEPGKPDQADAPADPDFDGPIIACDDCGTTLIDLNGGWVHPPGSTCLKARRDDDPFVEPESPRLPWPEPESGDRKAWHCNHCGQTSTTTYATAHAANDAYYRSRRCPANNGQQIQRPDGELFAWHCNRCGASTGQIYPSPDAALDTNRDHACTDDKENDMTDTATTSTGSATGDAHDLESASHQCDLLREDLTRIDAALDVIDAAIASAGNATELIEAFLRSKNTDEATVGGMSAARDMLSPERIKTLIDAMAAAKQGVQSTKEALDAMNEQATEALQGADGSIVNGR
jgi:hypothetical protein